MKVFTNPSLSRTSAGNAKQAIIGGGAITAPGVLAHLRSKLRDEAPREPQPKSTVRHAAMGGGAITSLGVAHHLRARGKQPEDALRQSA